MGWLTTAALVGKHAMLEPLSQQHHGDLIEATKDGSLWTLWYTTVPDASGMRAMIDKRMGDNAGDVRFGFVVRAVGSGRIVGMTNYMNADRDNRRLEIGGTWYSQHVQRTAINTECKLLLLTRAFEELKCIAVEFRTHFFNRQSRRAIERLGAKLDGTLRSHQISSDGTMRDTCVYSIIAVEWPTVRKHLQWQLSRHPLVAGKSECGNAHLAALERP